MNRRNLQLRLTLWFAASVLAVALLFAAITYLHLRHELQYEQWERVHPENPDFILHGSYSEQEIDDIAGHILHISLFVSVPVAALALLLGRYLARKSLRPVAEINQQLQQIGTANLNARIQISEADRELENMTENINALLERIEKGYGEMVEFSAQVAHELRTPLTLMRLQLEDASTKIDPELSEGLQDELQRLESYVDQCLLIARAERGQLSVTMEPVALDILVDDVIEPFTLLAREEGRKLVCDYDSVQAVAGVPWIIRQILHNFLSNALKHGSGTIHVAVCHNTDETLLAVSNPLKKDDSGGTGLGLRIVDALTRCHGNLRHEHRIESKIYHANLIFKK